jgi:hypothetical protein
VFAWSVQKQVGRGVGSLSGTEGSANLEVVVDLASFAARVEGHVGTGAACTLRLNVDVRQVVDRQSLTLGGVEVFGGLINGELEALGVLLVALRLGNIMQVPQEGVVFLVSCQLQRVLVVRKQRIVAVRQVSQSATLKE